MLRESLCISMIYLGLVAGPIAAKSQDGLPTEIVREMAEAAPDGAAARGVPSSKVLREIGTWLVANFELPATNTVPGITAKSPSELLRLRFRNVPSDRWADVASGASANDLIAVYDDEDSTIYVSDQWAGHGPAVLSVVVHEMVHHLQHQARMKFDCPEEREQLAYEAQERFLKAFGTDLETAFGIDPFTALVRTHCLR